MISRKFEILKTVKSLKGGGNEAKLYYGSWGQDFKIQGGSKRRGGEY